MVVGSSLIVPHCDTGDESKQVHMGHTSQMSTSRLSTTAVHTLRSPSVATGRARNSSQVVCTVSS